MHLDTLVEVKCGMAMELFMMLLNIFPALCVTRSCLGAASATCDRKHRPTYRSLFTIIKSKLEELGIDITVEGFRCDFEDAAIKEVLDVFPDVSIDRCFFPFFTVSLAENMRKYRLRLAYLEDENISTNSKMI